MPEKNTWTFLPSALPWAIFFGGFALYAAGASPGLSILDSGEFLGAASTLGVAHPTGYPLYSLLGQLFTFFPLGDKAILVNLVSAAAGAAAAAFLALAAGELARQSELRPAARAAVVAAAGVLALAGRTLWSVSTLAEVYALNAAFWAVLIWLALRLRRTGGARDLYFLVLAGGLALANHMTAVLVFPVAALAAWPGREKARPLARALPFAAVLFLLGISVNLYTPIRAAGKPIFNWNDPSTLDSAFAHLTGFQYRGNFWNEGIAGARAALGVYGESALANVTPAVVLAAAGVAALWAKRMRLVAAAVVLYFVGHLAYCAVYSIPDIYYYFIPAHFAAALLAAVGGGAAASYSVRKAGAWRAVGTAVVAALVLGAAAWAFAVNAPYGHRRNFIFAETYSRRLLAALPARAILFPSGDTNTFTTWYNVYVRRYRPDVVVIDQIRLSGRGYISSLARRYPDVTLPEEDSIYAIAERAVARGDYSGEGIVFSKSDDFILPEIIAGIIADNAGRRPMFWGLGDPATKLTRYIVPYDIVLEVVTEQPPPEEMRRRTAASVNALLDVTSYVEREGPGELRDPFFKSIVAVYYSGLSGHLARRGIIGPQEELFKSYVRLVPDDFNGYQNLGAIYLLKGQPETAVEYYREALALAPDNNNLKARLARALFAAGRGDEAAEIAESLEGADAGEAGYVAGIILREEGEVDKALAAFEAAREMYGGEAEFWWELGLTYEAAGDYRSAVEAFSRAVELNPASAGTYTARGVCYLRLGETTAAAADFEAGLALYPVDAKAHYNLACIRAREGRTDEAMVHLEAALALDAGRYVPMAAEDADLESCRGLPAFAALLDKYGSAEPEAGP